MDTSALELRKLATHLHARRRTVRLDPTAGELLVETRRDPLRIRTEGADDQVRYTLTDPKSGAVTRHSNLDDLSYAVSRARGVRYHYGAERPQKQPWYEYVLDYLRLAALPPETGIVVEGVVMAMAYLAVVFGALSLAVSFGLPAGPLALAWLATHILATLFFYLATLPTEKTYARWKQEDAARERNHADLLATLDIPEPATI